MTTKQFKSNCKLIITCINLNNYVMVGNIILPSHVCSPYNTDITNLSVNSLIVIAKYIKNFCSLKLSINRIIAIIILGSL